ncbi:MAG: DEAD/DEAH box helicase [Proteobacteria bacterium]|nr:DEAD/DEAH box helicase [Pseudomonadota bacterium]MBU1711075.1 DEAD/DEAH box helicase [Pseudomonadota bacterium]
MKNNDKQNSIEEYLAALKSSPRFGPQVRHHEMIAGHDAMHADLEKPLPDELAQALSVIGVDRLYTHQVKAIDLVRRGENVIVASPTASGKSLIYNLPVFESIVTGRKTRALYLFPLKALAQDQLRVINDLAAGLPPEMRPFAAICDGDTSSYHRKKLRENPPHILITNPDMLHLSLLGYHGSWASFWPELTHIIIDEVHTYRGVFGSHMAWVMRRLRRICAIYGSNPQFILSSATVGNPGELAGDLVDLPFAAAITETGAPNGTRHFVFVDPHESAGYVASQFLEAAMKRGLRTIVYTQSRKIAELVSMWTRDRLGDEKDILSAYRAGFLPEERREIEAGLAQGSLLGVVSTSALELGIDIGSLDICILVGYPGTIMSTWQRSGRVGRRQTDSLVILVAQEDALDQHFIRNPADFFARSVEAAVINPQNRQIIRKHLLCAAAENPIKIDDPLVQGVAGEVAAEMEHDGEFLVGESGGIWFTGRKYPHRDLDLRGSGNSFAIRVAGEEQLLGEIDGVRCLKECYPGAIYLHRGKTWLVTELDIPGKRVGVVRRNVNYFTRVLGHKHTEILKTYSKTNLGSFSVSFGYLRVTDTVTGFQRRLVSGQKIIATETLDLPPFVFETEGLWIEIPADLKDRLEKDMVHFMGGIHALEHGAIGIFPLLVLCDRNDVGGIAQPFHPQTSGAAVFIYDGYPGGIGLSRQAFLKIEALLQSTLETIENCPCEVGCPSCVHSPKCGSGNRPIDKNAALRILHGLLDGRKQSETTIEVIDQERRGQSIQSVAEELEKEIKPPKRYGVFDVETRLSAEEVGGWHRAERMGISVAVVYDAGEDEYFTYLEHEIPAMVSHLMKLDLVIGFNNKKFDNKVLSSYTPYDLYALPTMDILEKVYGQLGYRLSLDHLAEHTLNVKKSANGLMALQWYKEGKMDEIIRYCKKDVEITRDLYLYGLKHKYLLFSNKAKAIVRCPVDFAAV